MKLPLSWKLLLPLSLTTLILGALPLLQAAPLNATSKENKKSSTPVVPQENNQLSEVEGRKLNSSHFPIPEAIKPNYEFWKLIYSKYDKNQAVFHDTEHLQVIYSVLDFSDLPQNPNDPTVALNNKAIKQARIDIERSRIQAILEKLAAGAYTAKDLNVEERKIYDLFQTVKESDKFLAASETARIRSQTGQKDKFAKGIAVSGAYITEIEDIFISYGLPVELTRLPFVESMFNTRAQSKVGASGIWQFMPSTGRLYVKINSIVDERNDPILATHAAARLLKANYERLGTWPLAINAYNAGAVALQRAVQELGTKDIGVIVKKYRGGNYKFASRNFYSEFVAALDVANHYKIYFGEIERLPKLDYENFAMPATLPISNIAITAGVDAQVLQDMNPGYDTEFFNSSKPLPEGYTIRIPKASKEKFEEVAQNFMLRQSSALNNAVVKK